MAKRVISKGNHCSIRMEVSIELHPRSTSRRREPSISSESPTNIERQKMEKKLGSATGSAETSTHRSESIQQSQTIDAQNVAGQKTYRTRESPRSPMTSTVESRSNIPSEAFTVKEKVGPVVSPADEREKERKLPVVPLILPENAPGTRRRYGTPKMEEDVVEPVLPGHFPRRCCTCCRRKHTPYESESEPVSESKSESECESQSASELQETDVPSVEVDSHVNGKSIIGDRYPQSVNAMESVQVHCPGCDAWFNVLVDRWEDTESEETLYGL